MHRYDGQVFVKPPEVLARDRLLGSYTVSLSVIHLSSLVFALSKRKCCHQQHSSPDRTSVALSMHSAEENAVTTGIYHETATCHCNLILDLKWVCHLLSEQAWP